MDRPSADRVVVPTTVAHATTFNTALWVLATQCLLALSWTLYVLFLPSMLASAGIERRWFVYVLIADQLIFAGCDWLAGVYADRITVGHRRVGRAITVVALLSSTALLSMPWITGAGHALPLLFVIFLWAATSSALRAPVFALLGRIRESPRESPDGHSTPSTVRAGAIGIALVGISLAGAIGPYVTTVLQGVDPRLPIAVGAVALAVAGLWATRVDAALPPALPMKSDVPTPLRRRMWALAGVVLIAGFGTQVVTAIVALPLFQRHVGSQALLWVAWFWVGFGVGLVPGRSLAARVEVSERPLIAGAVALLIAALAYAVAANNDGLGLLVIGIALAGVAWGVFTTIAFTQAVSLSGGRAAAGGAGTASGLLFSAIAIGTLLRLVLVAAGWNRSASIASVPVVAWFVAGVALWAVARFLWPRHVDSAPARTG